MGKKPLTSGQKALLDLMKIENLTLVYDSIIAKAYLTGKGGSKTPIKFNTFLAILDRLERMPRSHFDGSRDFYKAK